MNYQKVLNQQELNCISGGLLCTCYSPENIATVPAEPVSQAMDCWNHCCWRLMSTTKSCDFDKSRYSWDNAGSKNCFDAPKINKRRSLPVQHSTQRDLYYSYF